MASPASAPPISSATIHPTPLAVRLESPVEVVQSKPVEIQAPHALPVDVSKAIAVEIKELPRHHESLLSAEWFVAYATIGLAIVTGVLAFYTYRLFRATKELAREASETAAQQRQHTESALAISGKTAHASLVALRPWLRCELNPMGLEYTGPDRDALFRFEFVVENVGKSPALNVVLVQCCILFGS